MGLVGVADYGKIHNVIKYRYALSSGGKIIDVVALAQHPDQAEVAYHCLGCKQQLIARIRGLKVRPHFAHKAGHACGPETYLHILGKQTFYEVYRRCLDRGEPFYIELTHPKRCEKYMSLLNHACGNGEESRRYDLTQYYNQIDLELPDDQFIPDLRLRNISQPRDDIYIEIAVTHFMEKEKRQSGKKIIEIPLECEDGLRPILDRLITEEQATFLNFNKRTIQMPDSQCECEHGNVHALLIYESGKTFLETGTLNQIQAIVSRNHQSVSHVIIRSKQSIYQVSDPPSHITYQCLLEEAEDDGIAVLNCFLCRHGRPSRHPSRGQPIYCREKRLACNSNAAATCPQFDRKDMFCS